MDEDNFSLLDTQRCTPERHPIPEEAVVKVKSKAQKAVDRLHSTVKTRSSKVPSTGVKGKATVVSLEIDDDDDFTDSAPWKNKDGHASRDVQGCSAASSDVFVTQKAKPPTVPKQGVKKGNAKSAKNNKVVQVPEIFVYDFPLVEQAKILKNVIVSKQFRDVHGK